MGRKKSIYTVKQATAQAFNKVDETFYPFQLVAIVRGITARSFLTDGTIMRRLRELREDHPEVYGYEVVDKETSRYKKRLIKKD
jgi:hypothetical protein